MKLLPGTPVLRRSNGLQFGVHAKVLATRVSSKDQEAFEWLENPGRSIDARLVERYPEVIADLTDAGLTLDTVAPRPLVSLMDGGVLTLAVARLLLSHGYPQLIVDDRKAPEVNFPHHLCQGARSTAGVTGRVLSAEFPQAHINLGSGWGEVAVLFSSGYPSQRWMELTSFDHPHLLVTVDELGATVGPLVVPGEGPCCECLMLTCQDADPDTAMLSAQCSQRSITPSPSTVLGVALEVSRILEIPQVIESGWPMRQRINLYGQPDGEPEFVTRHPTCLCRVPRKPDLKRPGRTTLPRLPARP